MKKGLGYQIVNMLTAPQPKEPGIGSAKDRLILQKKKKNPKVDNNICLRI